MGTNSKSSTPHSLTCFISLDKSSIDPQKPALAARLVELGLDRTTRPYAAIQAIAESFKIMSNNIADRENREELRTIKAALDRLEGGTTFDIYAESEE